MNYDIKINKYGDIFYFVNKKFHRDCGPAVEYVDGEKRWYKHGELHREDGPAIEFSDEFGNSEKQWWLKGKLYGSNDDFVNESWKKFIKTLIFS